MFMKTFLRMSGVSLLLSALIIPSFALAAEIRTGQSTTLSSSETAAGNLYLFGGTVTSAGAVAGDLVAGGGTVIISGAVVKDLAVGGGSVTVISNVGDDVRIGGGNILLNGKVGGDVVAAGGSVLISGTGVGGDVMWTGGMLSVMAPVGGNMQLSGGEVTINAHIKGNVLFTGAKLTLGKDAVIEGSLTYSAQSEATMEAGAVVKGATSFEPLKSSPAKDRSAKGLIAFVSLFFLVKFLAALALALVFGLVFKRYALTVVRGALEQPLAEMGRGIVVLIVLPVASVIALVTLIGIPFGILGLLAFIILLIVASSFAAIIAGSLAHKWMFKPADYLVNWKTILLGVAVVTLLGFIPFVGGLAKFLLFIVALGSMMKLKWGVIKEWR